MFAACAAGIVRVAKLRALPGEIAVPAVIGRSLNF
jgi:hypothetical protein